MSANTEAINRCGKTDMDLAFDAKFFDAVAVPAVVPTDPGAVRFSHNFCFFQIAALSKTDAAKWEAGDLPEYRLAQLFDWLQWVARKKVAERER